MSHLVIQYPTYHTRLRLLTDEELEPDEDSTPVSPVIAFYRDFYAAGAEYQAPQRTPNSEDFGIIRNLLSKYEDRATLLEWARLFWRGHAQPVYDHHETHVLRLFAAKIPDIKREG